MFKTDFDLKNYNTFGISAKAKLFASFDSKESLIEILSTKEVQENNLLILGGGSNMLLTKDQNACVLYNQIKEKAIIKEDKQYVWLKLGAGEVWHETVLFCIENGWGGIENMSLIPGTVGAAPIQNIGAYGVELKDVFESLTAIEINTKNEVTFSKKECDFAYRWSTFKGENKRKYIITSVILKLDKNPTIKTNYGAIQEVLAERKITSPTIKDVSDAVIDIRQSKLPDPAKIGNSGSFFKNPEIPTEEFNKVKNKFPEIVGYPMGENITKVAAGWLIDQAGWKGKRFGDAGVHEKQALVLVNYGNAKGEEIIALAKKIQSDVYNRFGIRIEPEVNLL